MENRGGAKEGTAELYFTDPDGLLMQLQDTKYCGGARLLGEICVVQGRSRAERAARGSGHRPRHIAARGTPCLGPSATQPAERLI
jgi:hypothetical protein